MSSSELISPLPRRLKAARKLAGLSQSKLGMLADLDESSAAPRVNQYEKGTHAPTYQLVVTFAKVLGVPPHYFYIEDDKLAAISLRLNELSLEEVDRILDQVAHEKS